jgi:hypothetical protein
MMRKTKVDQYNLAVKADKDICGLQIVMAASLTMQAKECVCD